MDHLEPRQPLIVCVGHASVDHVFEVGQFPAHPGKMTAHAYRMVGGGMAANAAVALARLGARVRFVGAVGDDEAGRTVRQQLAVEGIDLSALQVVAGAATSVSAIVVNKSGERQIFSHRGDTLARAALPTELAFADCDAVLVDPRWVPAARSALVWARAHGRVSMLDADTAPRADLAALVPLADWAAFSESGLAIWAPDTDLDAALWRAQAQGARQAAVTLGDRGARFTCGDQVYAVPAFAIQAVDTTGAGDVFHGALLLALARGVPAPAAFRYASAAAAIKCTRHGGARGSPVAHEVDVFINAQADFFESAPDLLGCRVFNKVAP